MASGAQGGRGCGEQSRACLGHPGLGGDAAREFDFWGLRSARGLITCLISNV